MPPEQAGVLIVGAGPAGLAAAIELKKRHVPRVVVVDREGEAGGIPRLCHHTGFGLRDLRRLLSGPSYVEHYRQLAIYFGVEIHTATTITQWRGPRQLGFTSPQGLGEIQADAILLATGCRERPRSARLVPGARPSGIYTTGSLQRFVYQHHLPVGRRAIIVGAELVSLSALLTLQQAGVKTLACLTELPTPQLYFPFNFAKTLFADLLYRVPLRPRARVTNIFGHKRVEGVEVTHLDSNHVELIECDTVVFTGDWIPEHELARLGGLTLDPGTHGPQVDANLRASPPGVFAAGNLLRGAETADHSALEGCQVAQSIYQFLQTEHWPEHRLPLRVEPPLAWVYPNVISATTPIPAFNFRSREFRDNVRVQVYQGARLLHSQLYTRLIVNETMRLAGNWLTAIDLYGDPLRLTLDTTPPSHIS